MKARKIVSFVALVGACLVFAVIAQDKQGESVPVEPTGPPAAVQAAIQKLKSDVQQMKAAGYIDHSKIIQDVQSIADAAKSSYPNPSSAIQDQIKTIQLNIDQIKSAGKAVPQQISAIVQSIYAMSGGKSGKA